MEVILAEQHDVTVQWGKTPCSTNNQEPANNEVPFPSLDEEAISQGSQLRWGKTLGKKQSDTIRLIFQNVDGIPTGMDGEWKLKVMQNYLLKMQTDVFGFMNQILVGM